MPLKIRDLMDRIGYPELAIFDNFSFDLANVFEFTEDQNDKES